MAIGSRKLVPDVSALGQVRLWTKKVARPESAQTEQRAASPGGGEATSKARVGARAEISRESPAEPRTHGDSAVVEAKLARIDSAHVGSLNDLVREINAERGSTGAVPWFDPDGAGIDARVLLLFESPGVGTAGDGGSGIVSEDNDDPASATFFALREEVGLARYALVTWNAVPWPLLSNTGKFRTTVAADLAAAEPWLNRAIALLPELRLVITFGTSARDGWLRLLTTHEDVPLIATLAVSQTSPNAVRVGDSRARILLALRRAAEVSREA